MSQEKKIFIAYSKEDQTLLDELVSHLSVLERSGIADVWYDGEIEAGDEWETSKKEALQEADIILLLISADFINSDYCYEVEMQSALQRHEQGAAKVIPVLMRDCAWHLTPFAKLQVLLTNREPIANDQLEVSDNALADVVEEIYELIVPKPKTLDEETPINRFTNPTSNDVPTPAISSDGFKTIAVANQVWMMENLKTTNDASVCFDDFADNCEKYGSLFNYQSMGNPCPSNWRIPTLEDWKRLLSAQGETFSTAQKGKIGYQFLTGSNFNLPLAGMFRGQPKGFRHLNEVGYYWTSSPAGGDEMYVIKIDGKEKRVEIIKEYLGRQNAYSCRCIKVKT